MDKEKNMDLLAKAVANCFCNELGEFREEDFLKVADLLGYYAHKKQTGDVNLKPVAENNLPDIISINLGYAVEAYEWKTHVPMTDDGVIVSGFWDSSMSEEIPSGYEMATKGRFLKRTNKTA